MRRPSRGRTRPLPPPITNEQVDELLAYPSLEDDAEAVAELLFARADDAERRGPTVFVELSPRLARFAGELVCSLTSKVRATP